jgi:hypothetical protein
VRPFLPTLFFPQLSLAVVGWFNIRGPQANFFLACGTGFVGGPMKKKGLKSWSFLMLGFWTLKKDKQHRNTFVTKAPNKID